LYSTKVLLSDPAISAKDVAKRLGVSLSTLYRHMRRPAQR
jgi:predicted DNA binding protein